MSYPKLWEAVLADSTFKSYPYEKKQEAAQYYFDTRIQTHPRFRQLPPSAQQSVKTAILRSIGPNKNPDWWDSFWGGVERELPRMRSEWTAGIVGDLLGYAQWKASGKTELLDWGKELRRDMAFEAPSAGRSGIAGSAAGSALPAAVAVGAGVLAPQVGAALSHAALVAYGLRSMGAAARLVYDWEKQTGEDIPLPAELAMILGFGAITWLSERTMMKGVERVLRGRAPFVMESLGKSLVRRNIPEAARIIAKSGLMEGTEEVVEQTSQNLLTKALVNPKQAVLDGVPESFFGGVVGGGLAFAPLSVLRAKARNIPVGVEEGAAPPDLQAPPTEPPDMPPVSVAREARAREIHVLDPELGGFVTPEARVLKEGRKAIGREAQPTRFPDISLAREAALREAGLLDDAKATEVKVWQDLSLVASGRDPALVPYQGPLDLVEMVKVAKQEPVGPPSEAEPVDLGDLGTFQTSQRVKVAKDAAVRAAEFLGQAEPQTLAWAKRRFALEEAHAELVRVWAELNPEDLSGKGLTAYVKQAKAEAETEAEPPSVQISNKVEERPRIRRIAPGVSGRDLAAMETPQGAEAAPDQTAEPTAEDIAAIERELRGEEETRHVDPLDDPFPDEGGLIDEGNILLYQPATGRPRVPGMHERFRLAVPLQLSGVVNRVVQTPGQLYDPSGRPINAAVDRSTGDVYLSADVDWNTIGHEAYHRLLDLEGRDNAIAQRLFKEFGGEEAAADAVGDYYSQRVMEDSQIKRIGAWLREMWTAVKADFGRPLAQDELLQAANVQMKAPPNGHGQKGWWMQHEAWHGYALPEPFQQFDLAFIGTGEGGAAFGRGFYFTDVQGIAETYAKGNAWRHGLAKSGPGEWRDTITVGGVPLTDMAPYAKATVEGSMAWEALREGGYTMEELSDYLREAVESRLERHKALLKDMHAALAETQRSREAKEALRADIQGAERRLVTMQALARDPQVGLTSDAAYIKFDDGAIIPAIAPAGTRDDDAAVTVRNALELRQSQARDALAAAEELGDQRNAQAAKDDLAVAEKYLEKLSRQEYTRHGVGAQPVRHVARVTLHKGKRPGDYIYLEWYEELTPQLKQILSRVEESLVEEGRLVTLPATIEQLREEFLPEGQGAVAFALPPRASWGSTGKLLIVDRDSVIYPGGLAKARKAVRAAHRKGLRFAVSIWPEGGDTYRVFPPLADSATGEGAYRQLAGILGKTGASEVLSKHGVAGIKYPTGTLGGAPKFGRSEFNYVIFNPEDITIEETYSFQRKRAEENFIKNINLRRVPFEEAGRRLVEEEIAPDVPTQHMSQEELLAKAEAFIAKKGLYGMSKLASQYNNERELRLVEQVALQIYIEGNLLDVVEQAMKQDDPDLRAFLLSYAQRRFEMASRGSYHAGRLLKAFDIVNGPSRFLAELERWQGKIPKNLESLIKQAVADGSFRDPVVLDRLITESHLRPRFQDLLRELYVANLLSGVPTHMVNVGTQTLFLAYQVPLRAVSAGVDTLLSTSVAQHIWPQLAGRPRSVFLDEVTPLLMGIVGRQGSVFKQLSARGRVSVDMLLRKGTRIERDLGRAFGAFERADATWVRLLGQYLTLPIKAMKYEDLAFKLAAFDGQMNAIAAREFRRSGVPVAETLARPTDEQLTEALEFAAHVTFMDHLGKLGEALRQASDRGLWPVLPFVTTLSNIVKRGVELTPGVGIPLLKHEMHLGNVNAPEAIARQIVGSLMFTVAWLALIGDKEEDDLITGTAPTDPAGRRAFYAQGKIPHAIRVGRTWISYRRLEPFALPLATVAEIAKELRFGQEEKQEDAAKLFSRAASVWAETLVNNSFISNVSRILEDRGWAFKTAARIPSNFVPWSNFFRQLYFAMDGAMNNGRIVRTPEKSFGLEVLRQFAQLAPVGIDEAAKGEARLDALGEVVQIPGGFFRQWLPFKYSVEEPDVVEDELRRLHEAIEFPYPGLPTKTLRVQGKDIQLDDALYREFVLLYGRETKKALQEAIQSRRYRAITSPEVRGKLLGKALNRRRRQVLARVKQYLVSTGLAARR